MEEVVIVAACRTAIARNRGALADERADDLLAHVLKEVVARAKIKKDLVEDIIVGCVTQKGEQAMNIARTAALIAGFPVTVPGVTIDRQCGSSQQAVHFASQAIASGDMDVVLAAGVESMTRTPMFSNVGDSKPSKQLTEKHDIVNQGIAAEMMADKWNLSRKQLDTYALESHKRALAAGGAGKFKGEIVPIKVKTAAGRSLVFNQDQGPRADTDSVKLAGLAPFFKKTGKITAGNASQLSDGASAVLLMSLSKARALGLKPLAKIIARSVVGSDPTYMLTGPIAATRQVLEKAQLKLEDIDLYEVNEAFAPVPLAWLADMKADPAKLNVNGGAIALGHPLGATGTKLLTSLVYELQRRNKRYGLLAICQGMGMANATIVEKMDV